MIYFKPGSIRQHVHLGHGYCDLEQTGAKQSIRTSTMELRSGVCVCW